MNYTPNTDNVHPLGRPPRPAANEPGTLGEQLAVAFLAIYLGKRRRTNSRQEWQDARALVLRHARPEARDE